MNDSDKTGYRSTRLDLDVLIVANFTADFSTGNSRFNDLARRFARRGANVELVTSNFSHAKKLRRKWPFGDRAYQLTQLPEIGYNRNVSLTRLASQRSFAQSVKRHLKKRTMAPDILVCAVPPPLVGKVCAEYAELTDTKFVVDIQDLWPEAFGMFGPASRLLNAAFSGMRRASTYAYSRACFLVGVSETYLESALPMTNVDCSFAVLYLGTDLAQFDHYAQDCDVAHSDTPLRIVYVGTLGASYDLTTVIQAIKILGEQKRGHEIELVILGDGPRRRSLERLAEASGIQATFFGRLEYPAMVSQLSSCHIAVNPMVKSAAQSVVNKVADYAAAGLPVINTLESPEYRRLLDSYGAGINVECGDAAAVAGAIDCLASDAQARVRMGVNSRKMAEGLFDRGSTYEGFIDRVISMRP